MRLWFASRLAEPRIAALDEIAPEGCDLLPELPGHLVIIRVLDAGCGDRGKVRFDPARFQEIQASLLDSPHRVEIEPLGVGRPVAESGKPEESVIVLPPEIPDELLNRRWARDREDRPGRNELRRLRSGIECRARQN